MLVGRQGELDALRSAAERAAAGSGQVFALVGPAGIGKTRLADEVAARARAAGLTVHWGRAWETGGAPAYWPWVEVLGPLRARGEGAGSGSSGGATAALEIPPALASLLGGGGRREAGDAQRADAAEARFSLFEAVAGFLRAAAARTPLMLVLDDLHVADLPSLELLHFVARGVRSSGVLLLATWRAAEARQPPVADAIARVEREAQVIRLAPLGRSDVTMLLRASACEGAGDPDLALALHERTGGNPLFVHEALRLVASGARLAELPAAAGISALIRQRAAAIPDEARAVLAAAAVLGREVDAGLLGEMVERPRVEVERRLAELEVAGLLGRRSVGSGAGTAQDGWVFDHVLYRDALYEQQDPAARRALHARAARAGQRRVEAGDDSRLALAAHHALSALPDLDGAAAAALAQKAAARARVQGAYEDAVALLERGRAAIGPDLADGTTRAELALALGWAALEAGRAEVAREAFRAATALARQADDARLFARAALGHGAEFRFGHVRADLVAMLEEALQRLDPAETLLRARLHARLAAAQVPGPQTTASLALARDAVHAVAGHADDRAVAEVAVSAGSALADFGDPAERIPVNEDLVRRARRLGDRVLELRGLSRLVADFLEGGDVPRADAVLPVRDALALALKVPRYQWQTPLFRSMRAMIEGRFDVCDQALAEARACAQVAADDNALRSVAVHGTWLLLLADRPGELAAHEPEALRAVSEMAGGDVLQAAIAAAVAARQGDHEEVRRILARLAPGWHENHALLTVVTVAEAAADAGAVGCMQALLDPLRAQAHRNGTWGLFGAVCMPPVAATVARLEAAAGDAAAAARLFEAALQRTHAMRAPAHEAWVRFWWGQALPDRAAEMLPEAEALAGALGMPNLAARARAAAAARPGRSSEVGVVGVAGVVGAEAARLPAPASETTPAPGRAGAAGEMAFSLRRAGDGWVVERAGRSVQLQPLRGLAMLAELLAAPGRELHATVLARDPVPGEDDGATGTAAGVADGGDAGELLDPRARAEYGRRLVTLRAGLEEAQALGHADAAEAIHEEIEALSRELARAVGLGGRVRRAGSAAERARVSVQRRLRQAIRAIAGIDADLGRHLDATVRTGVFCIYDPDRPRH